MAEAKAPFNVNISSNTLIKIILLALLIVFLWVIREILAMLFVSWVLSMALHPWVNWLQRHKIPRSIGILSVYAGALFVISCIVVLFVPAVTTELSSITQNFPSYYQPVRDTLESLRQTGESFGLLNALQDTIDSVSNSLSQFTSGIYSTVSSVLTGILGLIGILVVTFYMTVEEDGIKKFLQSILPFNYQPYILHKFNQIQQRLSNWLWGELVLMSFVGTLTGLAMWLLGVKYSLVLGITAGVLEFVPVIGPTLAAIPAIFFAFTDFAQAPYKPFVVLIIFIIIQQIENQILVPRIMKKAIGLNPIIIIISLLVGAKLGGFFGIMLSVPCVAIIDVFLSDFLEGKQREQSRLEA